MWSRCWKLRRHRLLFTCWVTHVLLVYEDISAYNSISYCGLGIDYCAAPDCQLDYGAACDGNKKPAGASTANIARPHVGSVPYGGGGIYDCAVPGSMLSLIYGQDGIIMLTL